MRKAKIRKRSEGVWNAVRVMNENILKRMMSLNSIGNRGY